MNTTGTLNSFYKAPVLAIVSTLPTNPQSGDAYILSGDNKRYTYNGSVWGVDDDIAHGAIMSVLGMNKDTPAGYLFGLAWAVSEKKSPFFDADKNDFEINGCIVWDNILLIGRNSATASDFIIVDENGYVNRIQTKFQNDHQVCRMMVDCSGQLWVLFSDDLLVKYNAIIDNALNTSTEMTFADRSLPIGGSKNIVCTPSGIFIMNLKVNSIDIYQLKEGEWVSLGEQFLIDCPGTLTDLVFFGAYSYDGNLFLSMKNTATTGNLFKYDVVKAKFEVVTLTGITGILKTFAIVDGKIHGVTGTNDGGASGYVTVIDLATGAQEYKHTVADTYYIRDYASSVMAVSETNILKYSEPEYVDMSTEVGIIDEAVATLAISGLSIGYGKIVVTNGTDGIFAMELTEGWKRQ